MRLLLLLVPMLLTMLLVIYKSYVFVLLKMARGMGLWMVRHFST